MRDRTQPAPGIGTRTALCCLALSAATLYLTADVTVPAGALLIVIAGTAVLIYPAHRARMAAVRAADEQRVRAEVFAGLRLAPAVEGLHRGPHDQLVGHDDRDRVVARLGDRYAEGYLTAAEHESRSTEATQARTRGQLAHVLRDLPVHGGDQ